MTHDIATIKVKLGDWDDEEELLLSDRQLVALRATFRSRNRVEHLIWVTVLSEKEAQQLGRSSWA